MLKINFIVNPHSGVGRYKQIEPIVDRCLDATKFLPAIMYTRYRGHAIELATQSVRDGADIVVAVGGDGTINEVASALVHTQVAMALIPVGSGNGLAHHLRIPVSIEKAIKVINGAHIENIDTLLINNHVCVSMAGVGFDALVAEQYDKTHTRGFWAYLKFIINAYFVFKPHHYVIESPQTGTKEAKVLMVSVANSSQWGYNVKISSKASMQDGKADVCVVAKPPFLTLAGRVLLLLVGKLDKNRLAEQIYRVRQCDIYEKNHEPQSCHIDGDPIDRQPVIHMQVMPGSLKIVTPAVI